MSERFDFKAARVRARLKQSGVAEALGVSQSTLSRYEAGALPIPEDLVLPWVKILKEAQEKRAAAQ